MAQRIEVPGQGIVEFPDSMNDEQIVAAIKNLSGEPQTSAEELNLINAQKNVNKPEIQTDTSFMGGVTRGAGLAARGAIPAATGAGAGFLMGGPPGAVAGGLALPLAELATKGVNVVLPQSMQIPSPAGAVENLLTKIGFPVPSNISERAIQAAGGALTGAGTQLAALPSIAKTATTEFGRGIAGTLAQQPGRQLAAAAPVAMASQAVGEITGSPTAGMLAGMAAGAPFLVGGKPSITMPREELAAKSAAAYAKAEQSGIAFNPTKFNKSMADIAVDMRKEGYTPTAYPKIASAFNELTSSSQPRDFTELQALRKIIAGAQKSPDGEEKRLASILKDRFDTYVANAPTTDIVGASTKEGINAWETARSEYSKMMKGDIFDEMLENAKLDASKFTQSGAENSMAQQLRQLAKNKSKMRMFTESEQDAITAAAKGGPAQNILKFFGRFAPTGPVSSMFTGGAVVANPYVGVPLGLSALASRVAATQMRKGSIKDLANLMRQGNIPQAQKIGAYPAIAGRGLLSPQISSEELQQIYGGQ